MWISRQDGNAREEGRGRNFKWCRMLTGCKKGGKQLTHHDCSEFNKLFVTYGNGVVVTRKMIALLSSIVLTTKIRPAYEKNSH